MTELDTPLFETELEFLRFQREFAPDFKRINLEWIQELFEVEASDVEILEDPKRVIVDSGGEVFFARHGELGVVGCAALVPKAPGVFELTKMGVSKLARGSKVGEQLLLHVLEAARQLPIQRLFLLTNKQCEAAIHLYLKHGFVHDSEVMETYGHAYNRCDVAMKFPAIWDKQPAS